MDVSLNVETHQFEGTQKLLYTNNSPDTLKRVFYHLYFNAFQPNSMMDVRSRTIPDPDKRVGSRIYNLKNDEIGKQEVLSLTQDGKKLNFKTVGTILEVDLAQPILPKSLTTFNMTFKGQVPVQIRRSGRNNKEGIAYTMTQWYPKMSEYDEQGWHPNPYVGREFHGVWGNFDVKLTLDASFIVAGSGYLQNKNEIGYGYQDKNAKAKKHKKGEKLTWHFLAPNVHDFAWAADPDYKHFSLETKRGTVLHFFYQEDQAEKEAWEKLPKLTEKVFEYLNTNFGVYPYKQYSIIQGGDGGMEYAMCTMITGKRKLKSLLGVTVHEFLHSWYQMLLATNESLYAWMDEGFTSYASSYAMQKILSPESTANPNIRNVKGYVAYAKSGFEEPLTTHADHFNYNKAYGASSYGKGAVFLVQLEYIIGTNLLHKSLRDYFNLWKFKHPNPTRFKRVLEKNSKMNLSWFFEYWINTTKKIDYAVDSLEETSQKTTLISLANKSNFPMPIDLKLTLKSGKELNFYIPLTMMRGSKTFPNKKPSQLANWNWVEPSYRLEVPYSLKEIKSVEIDASQRLADINRKDNRYENKD